MPEARLYDLLDSSTYLALSRHPGRIEEELTLQDRLVVIDETQRLAGLLNEVHRLIENRGVHFLLTLKRFVCVTLEATPRVVGEIRLVPFEQFLGELWAGGF